MNYAEYIKGKMAMTHSLTRKGIPYPAAPPLTPPPIPMAKTFCYSSSATAEFGAHTHTMPDGSLSSMHFHPGGNLLHTHVVMQVTVIGGPTIWDFDYNACPELCANTSAGIVADAVAVTADNTYYEGLPKEAETPPAAKPKADVIWELLKGACVR